MGEFTAIVSITPLVVTLMAALSLGEKVRKLRWALVLSAFAGTMVIVRPGSENFDWVLIFPFILIATNSGFHLLTSKMAKTEDPAEHHHGHGRDHAQRNKRDELSGQFHVPFRSRQHP